MDSKFVHTARRLDGGPGGAIAGKGEKWKEEREREKERGGEGAMERERERERESEEGSMTHLLNTSTCTKINNVFFVNTAL